LTTIPSNQIVATNPSALQASGTGVENVGLFLTTNTRVPIGTVMSFSSDTAVDDFFGPTSHEATLAGVYFEGFTGATQTPGAMLFSQYPTANVSAYLWGGDISTISLATLQGYSGTLTVTIDGSQKSASINLSAATSFSNAAEIIANGLGIEGVQTAVVTASIGGTFGTCTTSGTTLTLGSVTTGSLWPGDTVTATDGTNTLNTTIVSQLTGTPGGSAGATFKIAAATTPGNLTSSTVTSASTTLNVTHVTSGALGTADVISGSGITSGTYITGQTSGTTGATGLYSLSGSGQTIASEMVTAYSPPVQYDSVTGAFVIYSGTTGASSTITFGSGALATDLLLTSATGAYLSQGAVAATPAAFMTALIAVNNDWVGFTTTFDPDGGSGSTQKQAFAAWKNTQNNRYWYVPWDTDANAPLTDPDTSSLGYILQNNGDSGSSPVWEPSDQYIAAFMLSWMACLDFEQPSGRWTLAGRSQAGLVAGVTSGTAAINLAGNPQEPGNFGNGYNFYGAYGNAGNTNIWLQRGTCTGPFEWADSYVIQIVMVSQMQAALLNGLATIGQIPFNAAGQSIGEQLLAPVIAQFLSFGAFGPGPIDAATAAEINALAGANITPTISAQGWYIQYIPATSLVRSSRGPQQIKFWYLDNGSVQSISLSTVAVIGG
jgi:hypothetical protein